MPQIALVSHQHDDDIRVGMVSQFFEPSRHILIGLVLADVVDEQRSDGASIVGRRDGTVSLLASSIPDLSLDGLGVDLDRSSCKLNADGRFGLEVELVSSESTQQIGFAHTRVSDENHCQVMQPSVIAHRKRLRLRCSRWLLTLEKELSEQAVSTGAADIVGNKTHIIFIVGHTG